MSGRCRLRLKRPNCDRWRRDCLSTSECGRADFYAEPRRNFVASRAAMRVILGRYLEMPPAEVAIHYDSNSKPRLAGKAAASGLRFNLTHSGDLALVAVVEGCDIGVDAEMLRPVEHWRHIAGRYFHPAEVDAISAANPGEQNEAFLRCWTRKEAILKVSGTGLANTLDSFAVPWNATFCAWVELPAAANPSTTLRQYWLQSLVPTWLRCRCRDCGRKTRGNRVCISVVNWFSLCKRGRR